MNVNQNDVKSILAPGLNTLFMKHYKEYTEKEIYRQVATVIDSKSDSEDYSWLTNCPGMREFVAEREIKALSENTYSIKNKTWEATLGIERTVLEDDKYGQIKLRVNDLAHQVVKHKNKLVFETLVNGVTNLCIDGKPFFSSSHKYTGKSSFSGTQSNLGSLTLTADNLKATITSMGKIKDTNGNPSYIKPDTIVVPPDLEWTARELVNSPHLDTSNSVNGLQGALKVVVSPYITDEDSWYLLDCRGVLKPVILQERTKVELTTLGKDSEEGFMRDLYLFGVRARYNAGYSFWQMAYANIPE